MPHSEERSRCWIDPDLTVHLEAEAEEHTSTMTRILNRIVRDHYGLPAAPKKPRKKRTLKIGQPL